MQYNSKPMNRITLSRWDWYFRPISAPAAPANLHNDAIGSGEGGVARDAWNGVSCSAGNSVAYNTWVAAVNADAGHYADSGWITATVRGIAHSEAPGSRYDAAMQRIGELTMENELLRAKIERPSPLARRRSR